MDDAQGSPPPAKVRLAFWPARKSSGEAGDGARARAGRGRRRASIAAGAAGAGRGGVDLGGRAGAASLSHALVALRGEDAALFSDATCLGRVADRARG